MNLRNKFLVTTSWDDGDTHDIRLAKLLLKYKIPATFYIPSNSKLTKKEIKSLSQNFEIGGHTVHHMELNKISLKKAKSEILDNKIYLESILKKSLVSFCYPRGKYNQSVKQLVGLSGFKYARTTKIFERSIGDILLSGTSVHAFNHFYIPWQFIAKIYFQFVKFFGGTFHLWGHSWEIEKHRQWGQLEDFLKHISKNTNINQRITNGEIIEIMKVNKQKYYDRKYN